MRGVGRNRGAGRERGYVTVLVLMVAALLAAIVASTMQVARPAVGQATLGVDELKADGLLEAGVAAAGYALFAARTEPQAFDGAILAFASGATKITIRGEGGRIDLNGAPAELLAGIYAAAGGGAMSPEEFAARIVDWRDRNDKVTPSGAEAEEYRSAGLGYGPRNGPFQSVDELRLVAGMTDEDYGRLEPYLTVYNPEGRIDPRGADPGVLLAIPEMSGEQAQAIVQGLTDPNMSQKEVRALIQPFRKYLSARPTMIFRVSAEARLTSGFAKSAEAVIVPGERGAAYRVLTWRAVHVAEEPA